MGEGGKCKTSIYQVCSPPDRRKEVGRGKIMGVPGPLISNTFGVQQSPSSTELQVFI